MLNFDWLSQVPLAAARCVFLILFLLIAVVVLRLPANYIFAGVAERRWWKDLRLWAIGVLALLFFTYAVL